MMVRLLGLTSSTMLSGPTAAHKLWPSKTTPVKAKNNPWSAPSTSSPQPGMPAGPAGPVACQLRPLVPVPQPPVPAGIVSALVLALTHPRTSPGDAVALAAAAGATTTAAGSATAATSAPVVLARSKATANFMATSRSIAAQTLAIGVTVQALPFQCSATGRGVPRGVS